MPTETPIRPTEFTPNPDELPDLPPVKADSLKSKDQGKIRAEILHGPLGKSVLMLAYPSVATMLLQTTNGFLDRFFVGHLEAGPEAQAAVTVSNSLMFALMAAGMAISVGTTALVARSIGEGDIERAKKATEQSLILTILLSMVIAIPMWLLRMPILEAFGLKEAARELAAQYLGITILGMPTLFAMLTMNGAFRGMGDTVRPFYVTLGANLVHAALNWLLIFGNWGFPKMGLPGGATALAISQAVSTLLYVVFLRRSLLAGVRFFSPMDWEWTQRIAKIGLPAAGQQIVRVGSMLTLQILVARMGGGDAAVAALGVGLVSESIAFMPGFGYSIAASAFVGQNLGANQPKRANAGAWAATWQALAIMSAMGVLFWVCAEPFARFFIPHLDGESATRAAQVESTVALTAMYLRAAAWSEPFMALGMVLTGALQGAGETVSPTLITIVTMLFLRVPLAYFLMSSGHGTEGAWWAMSISTMVQGLATAFLFRQGSWQRTRV